MLWHLYLLRVATKWIAQVTSGADVTVSGLLEEVCFLVDDAARLPYLELDSRHLQNYNPLVTSHSAFSYVHSAAGAKQVHGVQKVPWSPL